MQRDEKGGDSRRVGRIRGKRSPDETRDANTLVLLALQELTWRHVTSVRRLPQRRDATGPRLTPPSYRINEGRHVVRTRPPGAGYSRRRSLMAPELVATTNGDGDAAETRELLDSPDALLPNERPQPPP